MGIGRATMLGIGSGRSSKVFKCRIGIKGDTSEEYHG